MNSLRIQMTRRGRMAVIMLDDGNARIELTVFNELFEQHRHWLKEDQLLIVEGKVAYDEFSGSVRIQWLKGLGTATSTNRSELEEFGDPSTMTTSHSAATARAACCRLVVA